MNAQKRQAFLAGLCFACGIIDLATRDYVSAIIAFIATTALLYAASVD